MVPTPNRLRSFVAAPPLIIGLFLAALGAAGLGYVLTRAAPVPEVQIPPVELAGLAPDAQIVPSPTPRESEEDGTLRKVVRVTEVPEPEPPEPPKVGLVSPASGSTYLRGQPVTYAAVVTSRGTPIRKVEFFATATWETGSSACNNSRDIELPAVESIKIGEATRAPFAVTSTLLNTGHYSIYAIVTAAEGVRQLSEPNVIFIENFAPDEYSLIKGWGDASRKRKYQDFGTLLYEHVISPEGKVWSFSSFTDPPDKACLDFSLRESRLPGRRVVIRAVFDEEQNTGSLIFDWSLNGARIVEGQGTDRIVVKDLNGSNAMATVVIRGAGGCTVTRSLSLPAEEYLRISARVQFESELSTRLTEFAKHLKSEQKDTGVILVYGGKNRCRSEVEWMIKRVGEYLKKEGIEPERVKRFPAGYTESRNISFYTVGPDANLPVADPDAAPFDPKSPPCDFAENPKHIENSAPRFPYQTCPDIVEPISYSTKFLAPIEKINLCPFNTLDPQDGSEALKVDLKTSTLRGIYGSVPSASYVTNGGAITPDPVDPKRSIWDLTAVRYSPGYYTAAVDLRDACGCHAVATTSVLITNFCQPCLDADEETFCAIVGPEVNLALDIKDVLGNTANSLSYDWRVQPESIISNGQGTSGISVTKFIDGTQGKVSVNVQGVRRLGRTARITLDASPLNGGASLRFRWTLSQGTIVSGQDSKTIEVDLGRSPSDLLELTIEIDRLTELRFSAESYDWSRSQGLSKDDLTYNWKIDRGEIVRGQGTDSIAVAGYLKEGTEVVATVEIEGLLEYCAKSIVVKGTASSNCVPPEMTLVDEFGNEPGGTFLPAKRKKRVVVIEEYYYEDEDDSTTDTEDTPDALNSSGREYLTVQWPNPVQAGDAITIKAVYNRQSDSLELKNEAGKAIFALKRPIATYWGKDYEVWGRVWLQSVSLFEDKSACAPQCYAMAKPISSETEQTWTFSLTAKEAGTHSFNLGLMIEGRHKYDQTRIDERPAWNAENLKIEVREDLPTHTQLLISSIILCTGGLGFCVRGLRFKEINIALFGGANIAGDQVGGNKVINEGDKYDVENAGVVGRNVDINNSSIERRAGERSEDKDHG